MMSEIRSLVLFLIALGSVFGDNDKNFYLSMDKDNYHQAFINCRNAGMELAAIENEEQSVALEAYLAPYKVDGYSNGFWLSGTNLNNPNSTQYYWLSSGQRAVLTNWVSTEPDNAEGVQHCMTSVLYKGVNGWADDDCGKQYHYVCEYTS